VRLNNAWFCVIPKYGPHVAIPQCSWVSQVVVIVTQLKAVKLSNEMFPLQPLLGPDAFSASGPDMDEMPWVFSVLRRLPFFLPVSLGLEGSTPPNQRNLPWRHGARQSSKLKAGRDCAWKCWAKSILWLLGLFLKRTDWNVHATLDINDNLYRTE